MFTFKYPVSPLPEFITAFARQMGTRFINNKIDVPSTVGKGYIQLINLPNDLHAFIMNFTLNTDMHFEQSQSEHDLYSLRFEDSNVSESFTTQIDREMVKDVRSIHSSVYLAYSIFDLGYFVKKGTAMRCITIQLQKEWLAKYFQMEVYNDIVQQYLSLKTAALDLESLDFDYKKNMSEVIEIDNEHPTHVVAIQNRIMAMVERFFNDLYNKRELLKYYVKASAVDIENVRKIERFITQNLSEKPPDITKLSKMAFMSPTKLKQLFKDMYGKPIYQYYQYYRMQKGREMLLSKTNSIKEVASNLGFANVGSFGSAFKKEFKILPSKYAL
ncbi:MAG: AraC family transcriptional regulator [Chitinophagaceae bacterium]